MSTETEIETQIAKAAARVPQIVADHDAAVAAHQEVITAEAVLLDRLIAIVKPALQALGTRPLRSYATSDGKNGCNPWSEEERFAWRGICATDTRPGPSRDKRGDDNTGTYGSGDLFLCADGTWWELTYEGTWSNWQGATSSWEATAKSMTTAAVARKYDFEAIIGRLCQVVTEVGSREKATAKAKDRAERLQALVVLLGRSAS
jgi:hypothetical protein